MLTICDESDPLQVAGRARIVVRSLMQPFSRRISSAAASIVALMEHAQLDPAFFERERRPRNSSQNSQVPAGKSNLSFTFVRGRIHGLLLPDRSACLMSPMNRCNDNYDFRERSSNSQIQCTAILPAFIFMVMRLL